MAVRLPVIFSQPARRDASTTDLIENIVAAALMIPGLDANLIGDIGTIEPGSTDHVCLLGHTRDLVLASFLSLGEARAAWLRLDQTGHFIDLTQGESQIRAALQSASPSRKLFYFQLALGQPVDRLLEQCRKLLSAQQLSLVSIQWQPSSNSALGRPALPGVSRLPGASGVPLEHAPGSAAHNGQSRGGPQPGVPARQSLPAASQVAGTPLVEVEDLEEWSALDKLVDDLDAMDL